METALAESHATVHSLLFGALHRKLATHIAFPEEESSQLHTEAIEFLIDARRFLSDVELRDFILTLYLSSETGEELALYNRYMLALYRLSKNLRRPWL